MNRHDSYQNTHIDWIPVIPEHWSLRRSKFMFKNKSVKNCPDEPLLSVSQKDGVILRSESGLNVWNPAEDVSGYKLIEPSDFVISLRSFEGGLELSKVKGIVSPAYTVLEKTRKIDDHYFWWLMKSHQFIVELNKHVTGIRQGKNIGWDDFSNIYLIVPPFEEQKLISRYLDKKTEHIDRLIEKIQKKIELIKEQRTSLINHYVTKGLDPKVEMKDSGSEWIGNIPKHWKISKFKYVSSLYSGNSLNENQKIKFQSDNSEDIPYISSKDIDSVLQNINYDNGLRIPRKNNSFKKAPIGSFLMVIEGGSAGKKIAYLEKEVCFVNKLCAFDSKENTKFQYYFVQSRIFQNKFESLISGLIGGVSISNLKNIELILPSLQEQSDIVNFLDEKTKKIDQLIEMENNRISLLTEYRTSLVSTVVKGEYKINEDML